ncbi:NYN domain-containing protein [Patescibacteria group bacterium]|nr:NYN domain-containing protein [Patescibacteria group bacterium]MBU4022848.1 NYN domain-containing protein [Patescibacteria group bacterium]MBU4078222.1 NYN domain-containing protein [Patescibacteria group bacterium]
MKTFAFIDASNLFYGGEKSLGWKIDYNKLLVYLRNKYGISTALYFGGVEIHGFKLDYLKNNTVPIEDLEKYLVEIIREKGDRMNEAMLLLLNRHIGRVHFYLKLKEFGYDLNLKPVKLYKQEDGTTKRKANCDVDMTFRLMKEKDNFDRVIILSGDGDFLPVLKYLRNQGKEIIVLARGPRTAREIKQFTGSNFRDFVRLEKYIKFKKK